MGSHTIQHNIKIVEHPPSDLNTEFKKPEIISQPSNDDDYYSTKKRDGLKQRSNSYERNDFPFRHENYFHSRDNSQNFNQQHENYYHDRKMFPSQFSTLPRRVTSTGIPGPHPDYYPSRNFYDKGGFNSSFDARNNHYKSQPLKSQDYSPKRHFDEFGGTDIYNKNNDYGYHGRDTGNIEEVYDKQVKMSRSMSAIPTNGMRYNRDQAYYYPPNDYPPFNSGTIRQPSRKYIEDGKTFSSSRQQSGPLPNYQYSNSGIGGGGHYYHSNNRYDNYHESSYGTKNGEVRKYDQQSLPYGPSNMVVTSQQDRNKQISNKSTKIGSRQSKSQSMKRQSRWASSGTAANNGYFDQNEIIGYDKDGRPIRRQKHYKVNCCCFTFKWPLWTVEPCPPPQRMYGPPNFEHSQNINMHENFKDNNVQSYPRQPYI
ncbi:Unconventional myosin-XV [Strongyloides ratti]|uniref:Unconventional myosin-XV n=1 Tax=Strongyloides ratti TaxID=34506 RepID=A0A090KQN7_STRRB|nr:Unconventional myosin-XV [Strongyloides ratti]CEF59853.1 Unconventional myosin-XV [Strongyloides ratti]